MKNCLYRSNIEVIKEALEIIQENSNDHNIVEEQCNIILQYTKNMKVTNKQGD